MLKINNLKVTGKKVTLIDNNGQSLEIKTSGNITVEGDALQIDFGNNGGIINAEAINVVEVIVDVYLDETPPNQAVSV